MTTGTRAGSVKSLNRAELLDCLVANHDKTTAGKIDLSGTAFVPPSHPFATEETTPGKKPVEVCGRQQHIQDRRKHEAPGRQRTICRQDLAARRGWVGKASADAIEIMIELVNSSSQAGAAMT